MKSLSEFEVTERDKMGGGQMNRRQKPSFLRDFTVHYVLEKHNFIPKAREMLKGRSDVNRDYFPSNVR